MCASTLHLHEKYHIIEILGQRDEMKELTLFLKDALIENGTSTQHYYARHVFGTSETSLQRG